MSSEENLAQFKRLIEEAFFAGKLDVIDEVIASDVEEHQWGVPPGANGPQRVRALVTEICAMLPDRSCRWIHLTADGDTVWAHFRASGVDSRGFAGRPPTGRPYEIDVVDVARFADGKVVEHWGVPDRFALLAQLGAIPARGAAAQPPARA
ncbi:MAG TPA: ester cyclase [Dehalococcoidia bacterium]|jgi:predicted ester cyclase